MADYDPGPPTALAAHFAALPSYADQRDLFWYDWGPVFYRRRLDRSARVRAVASDPGPTERIACRTLVGDAGQRVQGFLSKLGLTHSYVLLNAFPYALHPSRARDALPLLTDETHKNWRNRLFDLVSGPALQAIVAFGGNAREASGSGTTRPTSRRSRSRIRPAATPATCSTDGEPPSPSCAPSSPPTPGTTTLLPTTAPGSPKPTTPASRPQTSRSDCPTGSAMTGGDARPDPATTTPSNDPPTTPTTRSSGRPLNKGPEQTPFIIGSSRRPT